MSIRPVSDLVLDVARAADPADARTAAARLHALAAGAGDAAPSFDALLAGGDASAPALAALDEDAAPVRTLTGPGAPQLTPEQRFESFVVRQSVEAMSAGVGDSVFGDKISGPVWRSLMAEQLGDAVAARDTLGIAELLNRDRKDDAT